MGLIDAIAEKASDKIAQHTVTSQPATAVSNVSPQFKNVPQGEMKNTPLPPETGKYAGQNTNPALNTMGAGESDVAPGGPPEATPATPPGTPGMIATPTKPAGPVVGQKATSTTTPSGPITPGPYDSSAVGGRDYRPMIAGSPTTDPIKTAASQPGFWQNLSDLASKTGKGFLDILGNIVGNASIEERIQNFGRSLEGRPTATEQRLEREQQLRLQGDSQQFQKDYLSLQQGFDGQQNQLKLDQEKALAEAQNDLDRQRINNEYVIQSQQVELSRQQAIQAHELAMIYAKMKVGTDTDVQSAQKVWGSIQ